MQQENDSVEYVLQTNGITKRFVGITAVDNVSISIKPGEVRAIMGENGAGKSTLCNMLTGIFPPDEGEIIFCGKRVNFTHPSQALAEGIRMVFQERNLIGYLNGAQSICLGLEHKKKKYFLDDKKNLDTAKSVREIVGANVPLDIEVSKLSPAQQQMIEILRALKNQPKLLILDEPTASLGSEDTTILFNVIRKLKKHGVSIIIITHKLDEMYEIADTISIFRNGQHIITDDKNRISREDAVKHMLGRDLTSQYPDVVSTRKDKVILELKNFVDYKGKSKGIDLKVYEGEVVGLYGLVGVGRTELIQSLFGIRKAISGEIIIDGKTMTSNCTPGEMVSKGILLIPEERRKSGLFMDFLRIKENLTISSMNKIANKFGFINSKKESNLLDIMTKYQGLKLKFQNVGQNVQELSGGNQQKIVIARWIFHENIKVLIMDEPTQGIDVGVKHDIYMLIRDLARRGISILISSSDLPEITGICDRLYILHEGQIKAELNRQEFENHKILEMVL